MVDLRLKLEWYSTEVDSIVIIREHHIGQSLTLELQSQSNSQLTLRSLCFHGP